MKLHQYTDKKVLIQQFHIPKHPERYKEIQDTLQRNLQNSHINSILLLNERLYTPQELGLNTIPSKLHQIIIDTRLTFYILFAFVRIHLRHTWVIASNNDMYYDDTLQYLPSLLSRKDKFDAPRFLCLLRYEVRKDNTKYLLTDPNTQRPIHNCQDTWAFYSNECPPLLQSTRFPMGGVLGCDNRIAYILSKDMHYRLVNSPSKIHSFHNHATFIRTYTNNDIIQGKYSGVICI